MLSMGSPGLDFVTVKDWGEAEAVIAVQKGAAEDHETSHSERTLPVESSIEQKTR